VCFSKPQLLPAAEGIDRAFHLRRTKFDYASAFQTGTVVVKGVLRRFEMGVASAQPVFPDHLGVAEKREGPVNGCQADPGVAVFGFPIKRIRIQVPAAFLKDIQDPAPLGRESDRRRILGFHRSVWF
jgi:hypothetical protein